MPEHLPAPGPSYPREVPVRVGERRLRLWMARPFDSDDGWWVAKLWVADDEGVVAFRDLASAAGPPPDPPLGRLGPAVANNLSGMILEDAGRLGIRLVLATPDDPTRPWRVPAAVRAAFRFEPARVATMGPDQLAAEVQAAFRVALESLSRR
jgi:hypothetical protein